MHVGFSKPSSECGLIRDTCNRGITTALVVKESFNLWTQCVSRCRRVKHRLTVSCGGKARDSNEAVAGGILVGSSYHFLGGFLVEKGISPSLLQTCLGSGSESSNRLERVRLDDHDSNDSQDEMDSDEGEESVPSIQKR